MIRIQSQKKSVRKCENAKSIAYKWPNAVTPVLCLNAWETWANMKINNQIPWIIACQPSLDGKTDQ